MNVVNLMEEKDLELQNRNYDTAFSLAAAAGNKEIAMTMVKKNPKLIVIPGRNTMMPLYMAALFARPVMVRYLYGISNNMTGEHWEDDNRGQVLQKCVEAGIFDVALKIVNDHPKLILKKELVADILLALAKQTDAFKGRQPHVVLRIIKSSKYTFVNLFSLLYSTLDT
ncbi:putative ankyrin repeat-containing domain superfamily [Helianthus annuus]|nr:putative ankyrin repeat-containing domain superfamily [Helianthus annuus]KAJ0607081.1 putative ankyrin repeat-containing domain superfamily [Helianthus annuus]KAJ0767133.1 putative ankyrin repeat-containing domain superfamily [Helianthus annuus]KAJ0772987.1 putative ankyrin repeat-containing domain superfamily [Helianthus annuus]